MRRTAFGGHVSCSVVTALLLVHLIGLLVLLGNTDRLRLIAYDYHEVPSEADMVAPPSALVELGYTEDEPADLFTFRRLAEPVLAGAQTDAERVRRLGDLVYSLRDDRTTDLAKPDDQGRSSILSHLRQGADANGCGEIAIVMSALWRSAGGHSRGVQWATSEGRAGHNGVELYSAAYGRWIYYDPNLNGYGVDADGIPLSLAVLRSNVLTKQGVHLIASPSRHDWTPDEFIAALPYYPVESYALNNRVLYRETGHRFGRFARYSSWLSALPGPIPRILDNLIGDRDRRMVIDGKIQVAGLLTFTGARIAVFYLLTIVALSAYALGRRRPETL